MAGLVRFAKGPFCGYQHDAWKAKKQSASFIYCNLLWRYVDAVLDSAWYLDPVLGPPKIALVDCLST